MALIVTTDTGGRSVAINPALVIGLEPAPSTIVPASVFVRTNDQENFVLPGTVATVAALLAGAAVGLPLVALIKGSDGTVLAKNAQATAYGIACVRSGAGVYAITFVTSLGPTTSSYGIALTSLTALRAIGIDDTATFDGTHLTVKSADLATPTAADSDFELTIFLTGT